MPDSNRRTRDHHANALLTELPRLEAIHMKNFESLLNWICNELPSCDRREKLSFFLERKTYAVLFRVKGYGLSSVKKNALFRVKGCGVSSVKKNEVSRVKPYILSSVK